MTKAIDVLTFWPAVVLALPRWDKIQYVYEPKDTTAQTNVTIYNGITADVSLYMTHQRGDDPDTKTARRWDYTESGDVFGARTDYDKWQAGIQFRDPDWFLWTPEFTAILGLEHADRSVGFTLGFDGIYMPLSGDGRRAKLSIPGANFPSEAEGINSFCLLKVNNDFTDVTTSVSVELLTRADKWWQEQTFIQEKDNSNTTWLPFFFESNATKPYVDVFNFKVSRHGRRSLIAKQNHCELLPKHSGSFLIATVNSTGWSIADYEASGPNGADSVEVVRCDGVWEARKSDDDGDDYEGEL